MRESRIQDNAQKATLFLLSYGSHLFLSLFALCDAVRRFSCKLWTEKRVQSQSTYFAVRGQSYFSRLPKYWPPIPLSARRVCTPAFVAGEDRLAGRRGGSLFWKTREIELPSYSKICTMWVQSSCSSMGKKIADITSWSSPRTVIMSTVVNRVFIFYNLFSLKYLEAITLRKNWPCYQTAEKL
jgi:hypothetical protein